MNTESDDALSPMMEGRFTGREAFRQHIRVLLSLANNAGWKEIIFCDADFSDWPLGELAVTQSLENWARTGRKLTLLAQDFKGLSQTHARFVRWRQKWDHLIDCRRCASGLGSSAVLPNVLWTPDWVLHCFEGDRFEGVLDPAPPRRFQMRERVSELLKVSVPAFPATTLGL